MICIISLDICRVLRLLLLLHWVSLLVIFPCYSLCSRQGISWWPGLNFLGIQRCLPWQSSQRNSLFYCFFFFATLPLLSSARSWLCSPAPSLNRFWTITEQIYLSNIAYNTFNFFLDHFLPFQWVKMEGPAECQSRCWASRLGEGDGWKIMLCAEGFFRNVVRVQPEWHHVCLYLFCWPTMEEL